jgi:thiol:disulfide interchange protein
MSATERIAALMGRDVEETRAEQQSAMKDLANQNAKKKRKEKTLAVLAIVGGFIFAAVDAANPRSPSTLLKLMEEKSALVSQIGNGKPTVIDVYADWCTNCKAMATDMYDLEQSQIGRQVNFITIDADNPENAELIDRFKVDGIPHLAILDKAGTLKATLIGKVPMQILTDDLSALLANKQEVPHPGSAGTEQFRGE